MHNWGNDFSTPIDPRRFPVNEKESILLIATIGQEGSFPPIAFRAAIAFAVGIEQGKIIFHRDEESWSIATDDGHGRVVWPFQRSLVSIVIEKQDDFPVFLVTGNRNHRHVTIDGQIAK